MKMKFFTIASALTVTLAGCGNDTATEILTEISSEEAIVSYSLVTNVYGDGQKPSVAVLEYSDEINPESISVDDYSIEGYDISEVYVSTDTEIPEESEEGKYVLLEISTDYTTTNYGGPGSDVSATTTSEKDIETESSSDDSKEDGERPSDLGSGEMSEGSRPEGLSNGEGPSGGMGMNAESSNQFTVDITQTGDIESTEGTVYTSSETTFTTDYTENENILVENFEQDVFTTADGTSMMYNTYLPESYDENTSYPMVLFMPDATGEGSDEYKTLTESLGGVIWTTDEMQAQEEVIVLAPQYEESNSSDPAYTMELVQSIQEQYNVDANRLYLVGQSSGTIRSIKLMIDNPDTFAGAMLVAGQADEAYVESLSELADQNIWMISSAGDERAYPGMQAITDAVTAAGTTVTTSQWSADLSDEEQESLAEEQEAAGTSINWTVFDAETVMNDDVEASAATEHMNTWRVAYNLDTVLKWLLDQTK